MIELSDENVADLKAMQTYCFKKSTLYQGAAGADFAVMAQYLGWFINEIESDDKLIPVLHCCEKQEN